MIKRAYEPLDNHLQPNKVLVIYGPRRVGKTTLLTNFLAQTSLKYKLDSGDNLQTQHILGSRDFSQILSYVEGYDLYAIDEAQGVPGVGAALKILVDQTANLRVIATGSSSFELAGQVGEPLTGRKRTLILHPVAQSELLSTHNPFELRQRLEEFLVYGSYPEVIQSPSRAAKAEALAEIASSYLLKDILVFDRVKSSRTLLDLLKLLAFQVGSEVSFNELATRLGVAIQTVQRYLDLLEKTFVIVRLGGFSRNLREEVTNKAKYYFYDTGIRNAVIAQFNPLDQRNDLGQLWENFVFVERMKKRSYTGIVSNVYFWRTYGGQEIDLVEEREGKLYGYEAKWSHRKPASAPKLWRETYANALYSVVTPENYLDFIA